MEQKLIKELYMSKKKVPRKRKNEWYPKFMVWDVSCMLLPLSKIICSKEILESSMLDHVKHLFDYVKGIIDYNGYNLIFHGYVVADCQGNSNDRISTLGYMEYLLWQEVLFLGVAGKTGPGCSFVHAS
jgi:hypothetical protein